MYYPHMTHSPGGGEGGAIAAAAAEAAASFFAAASAVEAAGGLPVASTFGYLLPYPASGHGAIPAVAALAGAPLYRTTAVPPPPPVPHVAYFAYAPNTAPITVSITYPSSSSSSSSGYFDSPFRPCSRTQWTNAPCTSSSDDANSSASSLSGFRVGADAPTTPRRDRFRFGHGDWSASLSLDDAEASTMTSSPPCFPAILDEPECLEVQPVDSMFGAGDWTINAVVKGAMVMGGVAGGKGVGALTGGLASQGAGPCGTMGAMRRDSASSGASSVGESSEEEESCSSSQHSDAVTADSGRATGGLASSLSPMDNSATTTPNGTMFDANPMYEFEIPNSLVGLIIGVKGKTIKELSVRTDVRMLIRQHHETAKVDSHQICQVRGKREKINRCLQMLRKRFPPGRFPELNLQPVLPPALPTNLADLLNAQPSWLTLPESVACEAAVAHMIDAGHLFIQQPTHPSYSSLALLDQYMIRLYTQSEGIPEVPHPCETGLLCAAPVMQAWFRAVIVMYFADEDEALVRFVDYGGYAKIPRGDLRQIRTDLMTLPFQATECFLANVQPVDGTSAWSVEATEYLRELLFGKVVDVTLIGYSVDEKIPVVEIDVIDETHGTKQRVDRLMINAGFAKAADPSKVQRIPKLTADRKPQLNKQGSYTTSGGSTVMAF